MNDILPTGFHFQGVTFHPYTTIFIRKQDGKEPEFLSVAFEDALDLPLEVLEEDESHRVETFEFIQAHKRHRDELRKKHGNARVDLSREDLQTLEADDLINGKSKGAQS